VTTEFEDWRDEWDLVLRAGKRSPKTRIDYLLGVRQFTGWLAEHYPACTQPRDITPRHLHLWATHMDEVKHMAPASRRLRLLAVRQWLAYLSAQPDSGLTANPAANLDMPSPRQEPPATITDDELAALLKTCKGRSFADLRDEFIIRIMLDAGVRRGEVVSTNMDDLDLTRQEVTVRGKTGTRIVPIGTKTALAARRYLRARARRPYADRPALVQAYRPTPSGEIRMTGHGLYKMFVNRCAQAGLGHRHPHQLRHTWADDMLENGATEGDVEWLGGWTRGSKMVRWYGSANGARRARRRAQSLSRGDRV